MGYVHLPALALTKEMLAAYRKKGRMSCRDYAARFNDLMVARRIEEEIDPVVIEDGCLLCSEAELRRCHRRLAAESYWPAGRT